MSRRRQFAEPPPLTDTTPEGDIPANIIPAKVTPPAEEPCPGPCNHVFRVAENAALHETAAAKAEHRLTDRTITDHDTPFHPGKPTWCVDVHAFNAKGEMLDKLDHHGCTQTIADHLRHLPDLATWLGPGKLNTPRSTDIDKTSSKSGGARALAHAPSPSPGWDTADELIRWAVALEDWLRPLVGDAPDTSKQRSLSEAVAYLHRHRGPLLASSDAARIGQDVLSMHRRLEHLAGQDRLTHRISEPCPLCNRKGMRRKDGDELVKCRSCGATWDWEHFQMLCRTYADTVKAKGGTA